MNYLADTSVLTFVLIGLIVVSAGFVHGALGLGFPLVATPLLSIFLDVRLAILISLLPVVTVNVASILASRVRVDQVLPYWPLALAAIAGTVLGARLLIGNNPDIFRLVLAGLIFVWLFAAKLFGHRLGWLARYPHAGMVVFGFIAGIAAGSTNVMVAVLVIYVLEMKLSRESSVALLNVCFLSGKLTQIATFSAAGFVNLPLIGINVLYALVALAGLLVAGRLRQRIREDTYRHILRVILGILAVILVIQYFW